MKKCDTFKCQISHKYNVRLVSAHFAEPLESEISRRSIVRIHVNQGIHTCSIYQIKSEIDILASKKKWDMEK